MYESFYGLKRRPFAAAPDADFTVETPAVADAVERLDRCVRQGRGVGVLTGAAGMGKTHLCHLLARRWEPAFRFAILPNAGFPTPRGLLQAILAELDQPYQRLGEMELRLELTALARAARAEGRGIVLLLDEAHRYSDRLLDEVRLIANLVDSGEPFVRVVLAGQPELEDKLSEPGLAGLNERVGELVALTRLTTEESARYLRERAAQAGGQIESLFSPRSVELIVQACGGTPRCLNQLADHSLLLGYVAERRPVEAGLVQEALEDLKRLPLQWNDPHPRIEARIDERDCEIEAAGNPKPEPDGVIEIGELCVPDAQARSHFKSPNVSFEEATRHGERLVRGASCSVREQAGRVESNVDRPVLEAIRDRYARIDALEARHRWFERLESDGSARETVRAASGAVAASNQESGPPISPRPFRSVDPLVVLDRLESLVSESLEATPEVRERAAVKVDGRRELDQLVATLEAAVDRTSCGEPPARVTRHSILFSDLRRRRNAVRDGMTKRA